MIPTKLRLKHFIGIRSGLGRDELVLDLSAFDDADRLIALVGPNGTGKSTILDNLHPYRIMPSRAGSYSPGSFSYYDNVYGSEAVKELEFHHGGQHYRSILVFKMGGKTKKTECYLQRLEPTGDWTPYRAPDGTVSDGKTETYDRCIEAILGSPEMFFTSVFAAQNRRSLSSYTNGEIKSLLSELLGLEEIAALGKQAGEVAKLLRVRLDGMRDELARIDELETERAGVEKALEDDKIALGFAMQARHSAKERLRAAERNVEAVRTDLGASAEIEARRGTLATQRTTAERRLASTQQQIGADIFAEQNHAARAANGIRADIAQMENQKRSYQRQINNNEALLARRAQIEQAAADVLRLEADERTAINEVAAATTGAEKYRALVLERNRIAEQLKAAINTGTSISAACQELHNRAGLIDAVPCRGTDLQGRCELLADANKAKGGIPAKEAELAEARAKAESLRARGKEIETALDLMGDAETALRSAQDKKQRIGEALRAATTAAAEAAALKQAEQIIAHARAQIDQITASIAAKMAEVEKVESDSSARVAELLARKKAVETEAAAELRLIDEELAKLPPPPDTNQLAKAEAAVREAEQAVAQADQDYEQLTARVATHKERLRAIEQSLRDAPAFRARAATVETEIAHWTTLAKALGNDGIIALSIDDAGPTLSGLANDLLLAVYGPRFTVSLKTQEQKASGDMKETFDILVFDSDRDESKSIRDMSGGERIYINDVLTRAIALYQAQNSGRQYGCLFSDESDGALDPEKKIQFATMKREVLRIGGYAREYFISHSKDVQEIADVRIDLEQYRAA